ncbi:glycoside hydrolase family 64 protein, partial [Dothistroma septosporum NZE10]
GTVNAYVYGSNDGLLTFVSPDSQFYVPHEVGAIDQSRIAIPIPQGQSVNVHIPGCLVGGRMSFVSGGDQLHYAGTVAGAQGGFVQPSETNPDDSNANSYWSFMEFTSTEVGGLTVNPSSVDFAGIPIAMMLEDCNAGSKPLFTGGMKADAVATICQNLTEQAKVDGFPWDQLCTRSQDGGSFVRALSPNALTKGNDETAFKHYWKSYVDQVWNEYRSQDLVFDVAAEGTHICRVGGDDQLHCANDSVLISKPHTSDIFSCSSGPFEHTGNLVRDGITARLCAAFVRSTIHTGHAQPCDLLGPDQYYQTNPTNYFAKYVHKASKRGTGYAFAFDWVHP